MPTLSVEQKFSVKKARETQLRLSEQIIFEDVLPEKLSLVAGVDAAYVKEMSIGAVAVMDYASMRLVEAQTAYCKTCFPYIPTLFSFREVPPAVLSIKKLRTQPDVFLVDAHGFAHPYRCGFASHLGLVIGKPTVGVAKSWLFGEVEKGGRGDVLLLKHEGEVVGAVVSTKRRCKPVYVSVGHMISLETAVKIVKHCTRHHRIPEPVLKAHDIATAERRKFNIASAS
jgi:deoxyribonuclease V